MSTLQSRSEDRKDGKNNLFAKEERLGLGLVLGANTRTRETKERVFSRPGHHEAENEGD